MTVSGPETGCLHSIRLQPIIVNGSRFVLFHPVMSLSNQDQPSIRRRESRVHFRDEVVEHPASLQDSAADPAYTANGGQGVEYMGNSTLNYFHRESSASDVIRPLDPTYSTETTRYPVSVQMQDAPAQPYPQIQAVNASMTAQLDFNASGALLEQGYKRGSGQSDRTLFEDNVNPFGKSQADSQKYTFGSREHPFDTSRVPDATYSGSNEKLINIMPTKQHPQASENGDSRTDHEWRGDVHEADGSVDSALDPSVDINDVQPRYRGILGGILDLSALARSNFDSYTSEKQFDTVGQGAMSRTTSRSSVYSDGGLDPEDPILTGVKPHTVLDDPEDLEAQTRQTMNLRAMNYRQRRKEALRIKIQFNVTCKYLYATCFKQYLILFPLKPC
jgi:hypothetical protein